MKAQRALTIHHTSSLSNDAHLDFSRFEIPIYMYIPVEYSQLSITSSHVIAYHFQPVVLQSY